MKRWLSISFALSSFFGVLAVSIYALLQIQFGSLNVPSSPVAAAPFNTSTTAVTTGKFADAHQFFARKGITLSTSPKVPLSWANWNSADPNDKNAQQAAGDLMDEWTLYSDKAIKSSGLKAIYLVRNLTFSGQNSAGMPDPEVSDAIYFDISDKFLQSEDGDFLRRTYHHEFGHFIVYKQTGSYAPKDSEWGKCNAKGAKYGDGGIAMYSDPGFAHKIHPSYGFIDGYATSGPEEDKAEMFAYYMTDQPLVRNLAKKDAGIACKLAQTEKLLKSL